jgi:hypothetical protein
MNIDGFAPHIASESGFVSICLIEGQNQYAIFSQSFLHKKSKEIFCNGSGLLGWVGLPGAGGKTSGLGLYG